MAQPDTDQIFREVDEELRKERFEQLWKAYGTYVAAAALAIVLGVGGFKLNEHLQIKRAADAGSRFNAALLMLESNQAEGGEKALRELTGSSQAGYRALARMRLAGIEQASGRADAAVTAYDAIAADSGVDALIRGLAGIKAAMLRMDKADWTEMQNRLTPLKDAKNPWQLSARELIGLAAWKAGKLAEAEQEYQALVENRATPQGIRQRAEAMLALLLDSAKAAPTAATAPPQLPATAVPQPPVAGPAKGGGPKGAPK